MYLSSVEYLVYLLLCSLTYTSKCIHTYRYKHYRNTHISPWGSFQGVLARIFASFEGNLRKLRTVTPTRATCNRTRHLSSAILARRTGLPLVGPIAEGYSVISLGLLYRHIPALHVLPFHTILHVADLKDERENPQTR